MKTKFSILTIAVITTAGILMTGCGTDDLSTPTIVLDGDDPMIIHLGGTYTEPGFTATDDEDGDVTANVTVDDGDVDTDEIGEYEVSYSVTDEAGNTGTTTRVVRVIMDKAAYIGTYSVHESCDLDDDGIFGEAGEQFDYFVTITGGADEDKLLFENFGAYGTEVVVPLFFSGDLNEDLTADNVNIGGVVFDGDGTVTLGTTSAVEFELDYSATDGPETVPCNATYEKI